MPVLPRSLAIWCIVGKWRCGGNSHQLGYLVDCGEVGMRRKFASTCSRVSILARVLGIDAVITATYILVLMMSGKHGAESPVKEIAGLQLSFMEIRELQPWPRMFSVV